VFIRSLASVGLYVVEIPADHLADLRSLEGVNSIQNNTHIAAQCYPVTGRDICIAVLDTGVAPVPDLSAKDGTSRILTSVDFISGRSHAYDDNGHGTHVRR